MHLKGNTNEVVHERRIQGNAQLSPWNPYFFRPRSFAMDWFMAYVDICSGMER
jgi:hypothetical protein